MDLTKAKGKQVAMFTISQYIDRTNGTDNYTQVKSYNVICYDLEQIKRLQTITKKTLLNLNGAVEISKKSGVAYMRLLDMEVIETMKDLLEERPTNKK